MPNTNIVTLRKGTWFQMRTNDESLLGEIVDFQRDETNRDLYWLKCNMVFNYGDNVSMDYEKLYSSRDFEEFIQLELYSEENGRNMLQHAMARLRDSEELAVEGLSRIIREHRGDIPPRTIMDRVRQAVDAVPVADEETPREPERVYTGIQGFNPVGTMPTIDSKTFKTPLGSGDMKSVLSLYEANPDTSWEAINIIIQETGHLLLTYTHADLRDQIIQQKVKTLLNTDTIELEVNRLYKLTFNDLSTSAIYLGKERWAMHAETCNQIDDIRGKEFVSIFENQLRYFKITNLDDQDMADRIKRRVIPDINPQEIQSCAESGNLKITCVASEEKTLITKNEIGKNWEKAFVYIYYLGGTIDNRMNLKDFDDVDSIKKLATVRGDNLVLEALAA